MKEKYTDCVEQVSSILFNAIIARKENIRDTIDQLDRDLLSLLRAIGLRVMSMLMTWLINQVTSEAKKTGFVVHRRPKIKYTVIFGQLTLESPYLWHKRRKKGVRPVAEKLGICPGNRSQAVKRALTDKGKYPQIIESFQTRRFSLSKWRNYQFL